MKKAVFPILLLACVLLSSCGYSLPGKSTSLPDDVTRVYIALLENKTFEPFVENQVTNDLMLQFSRNRNLKVVEDSKVADALLSGAVVSYSSKSVSYNSSDDIVDYRATMKVRVSLRRTDNDKVLWKGSISRSEEYSAGSSKAEQEDNEARILPVISERLTEDLYYRIMEDF